MEWTDEIITRLQTLWQEGLSTAEIGRQLSITKNAVVGKAHRLGLPPRPSPIRAMAKSRKDAGAASPSQDAVASEDVSGASQARTELPETVMTAPVRESAPVMAPAEPMAAAETVPASGRAASAEPSGRSPSAAGTAAAQDQPAPASSSASTAPKAAQTRKPAETKTMAPDLMLRPLLRPLTTETSPRRGPSCCWPNGDPGTPGFHFCGARPVPGKPYCAEHCAIAYVKLRDRRESNG